MPRRKAQFTIVNIYTLEYGSSLALCFLKLLCSHLWTFLFPVPWIDSVHIFTEIVTLLADCSNLSNPLQIESWFMIIYKYNTASGLAISTVIKLTRGQIAFMCGTVIAITNFFISGSKQLLIQMPSSLNTIVMMSSLALLMVWVT